MADALRRESPTPTGREPGFRHKIRRRPTLPHGDRAVPSALEGLTAVFEMGTGVSPPLSPPETGLARKTSWTDQESERAVAHARQRIMVKPHGHLVPVSSTPYGASTPGLSTSSSSRGLAARGCLISGWASRLYAFSGYPVRT